MIELILNILSIAVVIIATTNIPQTMTANWQGIKFYWLSKKADYDSKN